MQNDNIDDNCNKHFGRIEVVFQESIALVIWEPLQHFNLKCL
jgi:hypothetical protein